MTAFPIVAMLGGAVALGAANLGLRLRGERRPVLIGIHLLLGIGGLEVLVYFLKDINGGEGIAAGPYGNIAAGLLALAVFIGLISPLVAKEYPARSKAMLVAHVACGAVGAVTAVLWASSF
jgi:hypothetical protein